MYNTEFELFCLSGLKPGSQYDAGASVASVVSVDL